MKMIKFGAIGAASLVFLYFLVWIFFTAKVDAGYVGVVQETLGDPPQVYQVGTGRLWLGATDYLYEYPTYEQNVKFENANGRRDRSIAFSNNEGSEFHANFTVSFIFIEDSIIPMFQHFRKDVNGIVDGPMNNALSRLMNKITQTMTVDEVLEHRDQVLDSLEDTVRNYFSQYGIDIISVSCEGEFQLPPVLEAARDAKVQATQKAIEIENQLRQTEAEAKKKLVNARTDSATTVIVAQGQARANELLRNSINAYLVQLKAVEKWNGEMPQVNSGSGNLIQIPLNQ